MKRRKEIWKSVPGWPEYSASSLGRIRRDLGGQGTRAGRLIKMTPWTRFGYHRAVLCRPGKQQCVLVSRLVALTFHGPPPFSGAHAAHFDGDGSNNSARNIRWATRKSNEGDKVRHGRTNRGERNGHAFLLTKDVLEMRRLAKAGTPIKEIAKDFKLSYSYTHSIVARKRWKHLP